MYDNIIFKFPVDGDVLCAHDVYEKCGKLYTTITVDAEEKQTILINGTAAAADKNIYTAEVEISPGENIIRAENPDKNREDSARVKIYYLPDYAGKYRVSLDDCVWFLRDIAENDYSSIFENEYLAFLKDVHDTYDTKIHANLYLEDDVDGESILDKVSDKYKDEWLGVRDWLRLSFHARANTPHRPYRGVGYNQMFADATSVKDQINRFAGKELTGPTTTLHWGEATVEGSRALRDAGYTIQVGDFNCDNGLVPVSYYLGLNQRRNLNRRYIWRDNKEGITFVRCAIILDTHKQEDIPAFLDEIYSDPHRNPYIDLLIHEQYFYPKFAPYYQENYRDKVLTAVKWAVSKGYEPAFLEEVADVNNV